MILYIAEKPSLGRAIADVLPKPHKRHDGYIEVGNGDCVSWCIGHLLEQAEPDTYNPEFKSWKLEHLPIIPTEWKLKPKSNTRKQFTALKKLIKQAKQLVNAGGPDRVTCDYQVFDKDFIPLISCSSGYLSIKCFDRLKTRISLTKLRPFIDIKVVNIGGILTTYHSILLKLIFFLSKKNQYHSNLPSFNFTRFKGKIR